MSLPYCPNSWLHGVQIVGLPLSDWRDADHLITSAGSPTSEGTAL